MSSPKSLDKVTTGHSALCDILTTLFHRENILIPILQSILKSITSKLQCFRYHGCSASSFSSTILATPLSLVPAELQ